MGGEQAKQLCYLENFSVVSQCHKFMGIIFLHVGFTHSIECIIHYDDACHLKRYACNPIRVNETDTTKHIASCHIVVGLGFDFIFSWSHARRSCNPHNLEEL